MRTALPAPPGSWGRSTSARNGARRSPLPTPRRGEVHVYFAWLDRPLDNRESLLSGDELQRAARFRFPMHRHRFVVGRALLRGLLARYLGCDPREVQFAYGPNGKPQLSGRHAGNGLSFNVSHSHASSVFAFTSTSAIGVDIERYPAPDDGDAVAHHFFSAAEVRALDALIPAERAGAFLRCWTRKEAYIKARGDGLALPLDSFDVSLEAGAKPALLATRHHPPEAARWSLVDLSGSCPGHVAALAFEGGDPNLAIAEL